MDVAGGDGVQVLQSSTEEESWHTRWGEMGIVPKLYLCHVFFTNLLLGCLGSCLDGMSRLSVGRLSWSTGENGKVKSELSSIYFFSMHGLRSAHYYSHCNAPVHYVQMSIETIKMFICGEFSSQKTSHPCPITSSQKKLSQEWMNIFVDAYS